MPLCIERHGRLTDPHDAVEERLFSGYSGRMLVLLSLGWLTLQMGRQVLPPLLPTIIEQLQITPSKAGVALTILWGLYALSQYPSGRLSDRLSRKTLLIAGLGLVVVGFGLLAGTRTYATFVLGAAVVGVGAGFYPTTSLALLSDIFVERRGQAFGLHNASGDIGGATAAGVVIVALAIASWQQAFLPVLVLLVVVAVGIHLWNRERYVLARVDLELGTTARRLVADRRTLVLLVAYSLFAFTWQGATGFLPTLLQLEKGFSTSLATGGFAVLFVVGAIVKPIAGSIGDRTERRLVAVVALAVGLVGILAVVFSSTAVLVIVGVVVFAAGVMAYPPVMQAHVMDVLPQGSVGGDFGAMRTVYVSVGSLGPTYVGIVAEYADYTTAFLGLTACLLCSIALILLLIRMD